MLGALDYLTNKITLYNIVIKKKEIPSTFFFLDDVKANFHITVILIPPSPPVGVITAKKRSI
jgi:hypothetical protein